MTLNLVLLATALSLNGVWEFDFKEDGRLEAATPEFAATTAMTVPGCWDVLPQWYMKHGTGLYRRSFTLEAPLKDGVLVVEGMGVRAKFAVDGRDLGLFVKPYARLEIPVGPLAVGEHTIFAAVDNVLTWPEAKLARPFYDFYFYGGFYHGITLVEREPKIFVRTLDYQTGTVEVEIEGGAGERTLLFDGKNKQKATFVNGKAVVKVPDFKLWSPEQPRLHTVRVESPACSTQVRFGIRQVEAKKGKIYLNGKPIFLKGFNRHESTVLEGSATTESTMLRDLQHLKEIGGNFLRGAHYQQCARFLDLCDELGVLVWEESLGWGNGSYGKKFPPSEPTDEEFCRLQEEQTREMVRASFNHPCVIIQAFLNECAAASQDVRKLVDRLVETIRAERSGRLVTFATCTIEKEISCTNLDLIAFNTYPAGLNSPPGTPAVMKERIASRFNEIVRVFRARYPEKPIMVSESGCGGVYGMHDPNASLNTEEFQEEYLRDIFETLWANPDVCGFSIWQMNDGRTRERYCTKSASAMFGGSVAGCYDQMRRPKKSIETVKRFFNQK